jgi:hypothetical protein
VLVAGVEAGAGVAWLDTRTSHAVLGEESFGTVPALTWVFT